MGKCSDGFERILECCGLGMRITTSSRAAIPQHTLLSMQIPMCMPLTNPIPEHTYATDRLFSSGKGIGGGEGEEEHTHKTHATEH